MPKKKKQTRLVKETSSEELKVTEIQKTHKGNQFFSLKNIILIVILLLIVLFWKYKGVFIAAMVNGQPISRWQLNSQLQKKFGDQVLENMISERMILSQLRSQGVYATQQEIDKRIIEVEGKIGGASGLDEALKAQSLNRDDFKKQLEIQISIDKMFDSQASVSATDIDDYIAKNKEFYKTATDQAAVRAEVTDVLKQQKVASLFDEWFSNLKKNANVKKFL